MRNVFIISSVLATVFLQGCTNQATYTAIQRGEQIECEKKPVPVQQDCMQQISQSYEDYKRERDELLEAEE